MTPEAQGKSFWDWATGPHPGMRKAAHYLGIIIVAGLLGYYVHVQAAAAFLGLLLLLYFTFKAILTRTDSSLLVILPNGEESADVRFLGRKKMDQLVMGGGLVPVMTSSGKPCIFAEEYDGNTVKASWIHEIGRTEFMRRSAVYNEAVRVAEELYRQYVLVKDIPRLLGVRVAGAAIGVYEGDKLRDISTLDPAFKMDELSEFLEQLRDPVEELRKKEGGNDV